MSSPAARRGIARVARRLATAVPGARIASYPSTGDRAFVTRDGRTTFVLAYPRPTPGSFGRSPAAARAAAAALRGATVAGRPVRLTGLDALSAATGQKRRPRPARRGASSARSAP